MQKTLLDRVSFPSDLRSKIKEAQLPHLADELRDEIIRVVSETGGHLGAGLGVVELTIALHYIFETPDDLLIWDVGHQSYPHKALTGRRFLLPSLRSKGGISGFTRRSESCYDPFGAAHSSTSISAGLGMAVARDLKAKIRGLPDKRHVICVIGDGAMSAGMAYEAINNAGALNTRLIVVLNDNDMSIAPPVGAMSAYLSRLLSSRSFLTIREAMKELAGKFPRGLRTMARRAEEYAKGMVIGGTLFEELGFYYVGPIDGHRIEHLLPVLRNIKNMPGSNPVLFHVVTQKGRGYAPAERAADKFHGVGKFDIASGTPLRSVPALRSWTEVFSASLVSEAKRDPNIVAITAAMPSGTGLDAFQKQFPERFFDVGIAEQHAVTFAAGMACEGLKPVLALYSTFLQRAVDQLIHDVAIQKLPVRFAIDRAGLVGADGPTHAGAYDLSFMSMLPDIVVMVPANASELEAMLKCALDIDDRPSALRYPRGVATIAEFSNPERDLLKTSFEIGRGQIIRQGNRVAFLALGSRLYTALEAASRLEAQGCSCTVANARFAKPIDRQLVRELARNHELLVTIEEGSWGGFASHVLKILTDEDFLLKTKFRGLSLPEDFIDHASVEEQYHQAGLSAEKIEHTVLLALQAHRARTA